MAKSKLMWLQEDIGRIEQYIKMGEDLQQMLEKRWPNLIQNAVEGSGDYFHDAKNDLQKHSKIYEAMLADAPEDWKEWSA